MSIGEAARQVGVSRDTLRRWEKKGKLTPRRSPTNRRYYTQDQLETLLEKPAKSKETEAPKADKPAAPSLKLVYYTLGAVLLAAIIGLAVTIFLP